LVWNCRPLQHGKEFNIFLIIAISFSVARQQGQAQAGPRYKVIFEGKPYIRIQLFGNPN
jgi:hypothetical protein